VSELLFTGADWSYDTIQRIHDAVSEIAIGELGLNVYPNQIEIISTEQMLDAYASTGMPIFYQHWSFGKNFTQQELLYRKGMQGLAYEIVINSSPCISYIMEGNSATMQTLVIAHAAFGHNHFFKNNETFREFTDASGILDYLKFAKAYIADCEEKYGEANVERLIDAAHALQSHGVFRSPRRRQNDLKTEEARQRDRREYQELMYNELWSTLPNVGASEALCAVKVSEAERRLGLPEENILFFLERNAPKLAAWQREVMRIVRLTSQYLYPQRLTKVMNEGTATYVHYQIMQRLHDKGKISDGAYFEFLASHTNVVMQPGFDHRGYSGFNPYALGFAMMQDIERICTKPTDEDRIWAPDIAGVGDPMGALKNIWANFRDDSFIAQYLSPRLIRDLRLFSILDDPDEPELVVNGIHDERGYRTIRRALAKRYDASVTDPMIEVTSVDLLGDRRLVLEHKVAEGRLLAAPNARKVLQHIANLWGYEVVLKEVDSANGDRLTEHYAQPSERLVS
jgi:stage V sporulation protein R